MNYRKANVKHDRYNGLLLKVEQTTPETTLPKLLDSILEGAGIRELSNKELDKLMREARSR